MLPADRQAKLVAFDVGNVYEMSEKPKQNQATHRRVCVCLCINTDSNRTRERESPRRWKRRGERV